ncbi:hypothetical protein AB0F91_42795 [Amycolatopsis sp. NPDC023774]|uniref:hypothetical protein n=1 Tax=Amycolatopsis sp. NPDC023774 TaxID=3155015 RepID=UPI0033E0F0A1
MDPRLREDTERKLDQLTDHPDMDLHLRIQEHRLEGYAWCNGRRYRIMGVRDEEDAAEEPDGGRPDRCDGPGRRFGG